MTNSKREKIKKLLNNMSAGTKSKSWIDAIPEQSKQYLEPYKKELEPYMNSEKLNELFVDVYDKHLSEKTIEDIIAFHETESGQAYCQKMGLISKECMEASYTWAENLFLNIINDARKIDDSNLN